MFCSLEWQLLPNIIIPLSFPVSQQYGISHSLSSLISSLRDPVQLSWCQNCWRHILYLLLVSLVKFGENYCSFLYQQSFWLDWACKSLGKNCLSTGSNCFSSGLVDFCSPGVWFSFWYSSSYTSMSACFYL